ncbi:cold shock domain-containing protein [Streptomyces sp. NPDC005899]|uniref:cold-shock protein n=1 Tax=Streptomyces sp. NPDC005899 TaxID=3155716 RepID=UPI0033E59F88
MSQGTVKTLDADSGTGTIAQDEGADLPLRYSDIQEPGDRGLEVGQRVEYQVAQGPQGPQAVHVRSV